MLKAIIKLDSEYKGKLFLKYSYIRNNEKSIRRFENFLKNKYQVHYINYYEDGLFLRREYFRKKDVL